MYSPPSEQDDDHNTPSGHRSLFCDVCGGNDFDDGDDGFFYCSQCGSQSQSVVATAADADDVYGGEGGVGALYSIFHHRSKPSFKVPFKEEILRPLTHTATDYSKKESAERFCGFEDGSSSPQDFGNLDCKDPVKAVAAIRLRYVRGLQLMLQLQCEALVEKFGVSPFICGVAMTIWLKYVAVSRVFGDGWVERMVDEAKVAAAAKSTERSRAVDPVEVFDEEEKWETRRKISYKSRTGQPKSFEQKSISISFRFLRKMIPIYSTLSISFLSCHLAREAVLPTDIYNWASEAKLPYLSAFTELEKSLGALEPCLLSSRLMFRPFRVISASLLEATAASIAQSIGLRIPSVNFYAIARRFLQELSLPVAKILPHACRLYEWSLPSELWLSSSHCALPTRVYVMSILIVVIRILYNIHGQGIWERSLSDMSNSSSFGLEDGGAARKDDTTVLSALNGFRCGQNTEFCTRELLQILDTAYRRMNITHDYSKDLRSYLKYCKDVIFSGMSQSYEEGKLIQRLWDLYDKKEDGDQDADEKTDFFELKPQIPMFGESINASMDFKDAVEEKQDSPRKKACILSNYTSAARNSAIEQMKFDMEDNGFQYLPPKVVKKKNIYLHYRRMRTDGNFIYVAHADYYILLRACARLAQVNARILHFGVLKFEKRLDWIEQRIDQSLSLLRKCSSGS